MKNYNSLKSQKAVAAQKNLCMSVYIVHIGRGRHNDTDWMRQDGEGQRVRIPKSQEPTSWPIKWEYF